MKNFHYANVQKTQKGGKKTVKKVTIKNGKGKKSVTHYKNGKITRSIKKSLKWPRDTVVVQVPVSVWRFNA
jgi:3-oxoacyl-[acyl-carrier-protein] synthase III